MPPGKKVAVVACMDARLDVGREEVILIQHTDCGMLTFTEEAFKQQIFEDTG